jgi:hypothetical protein
MAASPPSLPALPPASGRQPASADERAAMGCFARGLLAVAVGGLLVVGVPALLLFGGLKVLQDRYESPGASEAKARAVVVDYYAAVAAHNWGEAGYAFDPTLTPGEVAAAWYPREAVRGRVAGFTVTAVAIVANVPQGTVTGTVRYADGTTEPVTVPIRRRQGPYNGSNSPNWRLVAP